MPVVDMTVYPNTSVPLNPRTVFVPTVWVGPLGPPEGPEGMTTIIKATITSPIVRVPAMRPEEV